MNMLLIGGLGMSEIVLILLVVLVFFGGKKIPEMMRGLGQGVRSFKEGMDGTAADKKEDASSDKESDK